MFRSERMSLCDVYLQPDMVFDVMTHLGDMGCVQFTDMTPDVEPGARKYVSEICRCTEMERKMLFIKDEMKKDNIEIPELETKAKTLQLKDMGDLETTLTKYEHEILSMSENQSTLLKNYLELTELQYLLELIGPLLGNSSFKEKSLERSVRLDLGFTGHLYITTGVIKRSKSFPFEIVLWRISHGNIYYKLAPKDVIEIDTQTDQEIRKVGFIIICQGHELQARVEKICRGFRANLYECPEDYGERLDMIWQLNKRISDIRQVMKTTSFYRCKSLRAVGKKWGTWMVQILKSKAVYHNMNMFSLDITRECLIGQCWVPDHDLPLVTKTIDKISTTSGNNVPSFISKTETRIVPPTYQRTNKFTKGFQALITAFSDSKYREINPGLFTIITFPFLFAVMFGDVCHGILMVAFAAWMISDEKKHMEKISSNEIWNIFFGGRYVILLMGLFSMFTGFFYNSYFSKSFMFHTPYWLNHFKKEDLENSHLLTLDPSMQVNQHYMVGVDPIWSLANNEILFLNSIKMKMSIIIGVIHMTFGLLLSFLNHLYFKSYYAIILEFLPRMIFLTFLFMWLVIMMFMKWFMFGAHEETMQRQPGCAPLILIYFINMLLMSTTTPVSEGCDAYMFPQQHTLQKILLFIALCTVPIMLFGSPIYVFRLYKNKRQLALAKHSQFRRYQLKDIDKKAETIILAEANKYNVSFGTLMINEAIHTIEFVLSTVSHTASYLRLWALSLAHEQLSHMLWHMIIMNLALRDTSILGSFKIFIVFAIWAVFTLSVLVVMEGLSAFLHTLRLHWVEFMSKFFSGTGWPFRPFSFKAILSPERKIDDPAYCKKRKVPGEIPDI